MSEGKRAESIYHGRVLESVNYPSPFLQTVVWYVWAIGLLLLVSGLFPAIRQGLWIALIPGLLTLLPSSAVIWLFAWRRDGKRILAQCPLCEAETRFVVPSLRALNEQPFQVPCQHCPAQLTFFDGRIICYHSEIGSG